MRKQHKHIMSSSASLLLAWVTFYFIVLSQIVMMASSTKLLDQSAERNLNLFDTRIIGGKEAPEDRHPYSVSLQQSNFHFCGGSLILKDVVLTAAHCLNGGNFDVLIGRHDFNDNDGEKISVSRTIIHPLYNKDEDSYDVGLVILSSPVQDKNIPLIALNNDNSYPQPGTIAHVMGWGDVDPSSALVTVDELHIVSVEVISNEECETITIGGQNYEGMIFDSMLCASTEGQDACQGDSGEFERTSGMYCATLFTGLIIDSFTSLPCN
jgi:secreted trypsin-like serine protease